MSVWCSVNAILIYMFMTSHFDNLSIFMKIIVSIIYVILFFGGMIYDSKTQDRIIKLEREIEKLKENLSNKNNDFNLKV